MAPKSPQEKTSKNQHSQNTDLDKSMKKLKQQWKTQGTAMTKQKRKSKTQGTAMMNKWKLSRSPGRPKTVHRELAVTLNLSEHEDLKLKRKCEKTLEAAWNTSAVLAKIWKSQNTKQKQKKT